MKGPGLLDIWRTRYVSIPVDGRPENVEALLRDTIVRTRRIHTGSPGSYLRGEISHVGGRVRLQVVFGRWGSDWVRVFRGAIVHGDGQTFVEGSFRTDAFARGFTAFWLIGAGTFSALFVGGYLVSPSTTDPLLLLTPAMPAVAVGLMSVSMRQSRRQEDALIVWLERQHFDLGRIW